MTWTPKFAEPVTNTMASETNPQRTGLFVRVVRRTGRVMNPGTWWELTDGHGTFWQVAPKNCVQTANPPCHRCGRRPVTNEIEGRVLVCADCAGDEELREHARREWR